MKKRIFVIIVFFLINILLCFSVCFASIRDDADSFLNAASGSSGNESAMNAAITEMAGVLTGAGVIVSVVVAGVLGIQFMTGSMDQQAKVKESIIPYICGCVVVFGAHIIWQIATGTLSVNDAAGGINISVTKPSGGSEFDAIGRNIFGIIQGVGIGVSVIALVIIGIKYMIGSAEEKAEYKSSMIPYIIGVFFLAGATTIPNIIYRWVN